MVLHRADDDLVAFINKLAPVGIGHEIAALGGAADEDALLRLGGVDKAFYLFTRGLIGAGRLLAKIMDAPVNVGMFLGEVFGAAVDNQLRHLRGTAVVQVDERFTVHRLRENRKIFSDLIYVPIVHFFYCCHNKSISTGSPTYLPSHIFNFLLNHV